jgi:hypothetical protein
MKYNLAMVKALVVAILLLTATPVLAADVNSFCAYRSPEQYVCDVSEGSKIINGKRVYCARGLLCAGMDDSVGFRVSGTCQLKRNPYQGACLATHFAGPDGKWHPLSMRDLASPGPESKSLPSGPSLDSGPSDFQTNPSSYSSSKLLDAFNQYDDTPQALTPPPPGTPAANMPSGKDASSPFYMPPGEYTPFTPFIPSEPGITTIEKTPPAPVAPVTTASEKTGFISASSAGQQSWFQQLQNYASNTWNSVYNFFTQ